MNVKKSRAICPNCGKEVKRHVDQYCNNSCQMEYQYRKYIERWLNGEETGITGKSGTSSHIRKYLFELHSSSCQICHWSQVNPHTGLIPLELHHIDGDWRNNKLDNLQLLCPNCHSLTGTNGSLNIGKGRPYTRIYK